MGRPRKPSSLKLLHGDFDINPQRQNHNEPKPETGCPDCPAYLTGEARKEWKRIAAELGKIKVLTMVDRAGLEQYCKTYELWRKCLLETKRHGLIIVEPLFDRLGNEVGSKVSENPAAKMARAYSDQIQRLLAQFGLTPAARTRLSVEKETAPVRMRRQR
jgi:P27 family predicted phage terminase small subunit